MYMEEATSVGACASMSDPQMMAGCHGIIPFSARLAASDPSVLTLNDTNKHCWNETWLESVVPNDWLGCNIHSPVVKGIFLNFSTSLNDCENGEQICKSSAMTWPWRLPNIR